MFNSDVGEHASTFKKISRDLDFRKAICRIQYTRDFNCNGE